MDVYHRDLVQQRAARHFMGERGLHDSSDDTLLPEIHSATVIQAAHQPWLRGSP